jgi:hypothetical protein
MRELLRCSVKIGCAVLAMTNLACRAGEAPSPPSRPAGEKLIDEQLAGGLLSHAAIVPPRPIAGHQNLRLDCGKIGQAQRSLKDARRRGARLTPVVPAAPDIRPASVPPTRDELYHISLNEERFAGLSHQFRCGRR